MHVTMAPTATNSPLVAGRAAWPADSFEDDDEEDEALELRPEPEDPEAEDPEDPEEPEAEDPDEPVAIALADTLDTAALQELATLAEDLSEAEPSKSHAEEFSSWSS